MKWSGLVALAGCVFAGGCDYVFRLDHLDDPVDATPDAIPEACPMVDYIPAANTPAQSRYRYVSLVLTWDQAELDCENDSNTKVTHLVVFDDPSEEEALRQFIIGGGFPTFQAFTGYARDATSQGGVPFQFTSVLGQPLDVASPLWETMVGEAEPDNGGTGGEETITFFDTYRKLADGPANAQETYLCECDGKRANHTFKIR